MLSPPRVSNVCDLSVCPFYLNRRSMPSEAGVPRTRREKEKLTQSTHTHEVDRTEHDELEQIVSRYVADEAVGRALLEHLRRRYVVDAPGAGHGADERLHQSSRFAKTTRFGQLSAAARGKAHALTVLRCLALGTVRFGELKGAAELDDQQLTRVLKWGTAHGLVTRTGDNKNAAYSLSALGELIVEGCDEPAWLLPATALLRILVRKKVESPACERLQTLLYEDPLADEAVLLTGLSKHQVVRSSTVMLGALDRWASSELAAVLWATPESFRHITVAPPVYPQDLQKEVLFKGRTRDDAPDFVGNEGMYAPRLDALAEMLVIRTFDRSGIRARALRELVPARYMRKIRDNKPFILHLDKPVVSLSSPAVSPVSLGLLLAYGSEVSFDPAVGEINWGANCYQLSKEHDYGMIVRIYDQHSETSHFVLAGLKPSGTYAACRYFYENVESHLREWPQDSFAVIVRTHRGYWRRKREVVVAVEAERITTTPPPEHLRKLDLRYLDALPLIADEFLRGPPGISEPLTRQLRRCENDFKLLPRINSVRDPDVALYSRARDLASIYLEMGKLQQLVVYLLAAKAARNRIDSNATLRNFAKEGAPALIEILSAQRVAGYTASAVATILVADPEWADDFIRACGGKPDALKRLELRTLPTDLPPKIRGGGSQERGNKKPKPQENVA